MVARPVFRPGGRLPGRARGFLKCWMVARPCPWMARPGLAETVVFRPGGRWPGNARGWDSLLIVLQEMCFLPSQYKKRIFRKSPVFQFYHKKNACFLLSRSKNGLLQRIRFSPFVAVWLCSARSFWGSFCYGVIVVVVVGVVVVVVVVVVFLL